MQLPHTLSPAFCCLLTLAAQHVAGLVIPRGALVVIGGDRLRGAIDHLEADFGFGLEVDVDAVAGVVTPRGALGVGAEIGVGADLDVGVDADLDLGVDLDVGVDADLDVGVDAEIDVGVDADLDVGVAVGVDACLEAEVGVDASLEGEAQGEHYFTKDRAYRRQSKPAVAGAGLAKGN